MKYAEYMSIGALMAGLILYLRSDPKTKPLATVFVVAYIITLVGWVLVKGLDSLNLIP